MSYAKNIVKNLSKSGMKVLADVDTVRDFYDTGSYMLNAIMSASIYGGIASNRVSIFAGEPATGKSYLILSILQKFSEKYGDGLIFFNDTEGTDPRDLFEPRNINLDNVIFNEPDTVEAFRTNLSNVIDQYIAIDEKERPRMITVLDSIGMLSSIKEMGDIDKAEAKTDMTRAKGIKGAVRALTVRLKKANVPLLISNHVYDSQNMFKPGQVMSGGQGIRYAATTVVYLSKKKDKENIGEGVIITATANKARLSREGSSVELRLSYKDGLDRYYGLLDFSVKHGLIKQNSSRYEMPDGSTHFRKHIEAEPTKYFDIEMLNKVESLVREVYAYGSPAE